MAEQIEVMPEEPDQADGPAEDSDPEPMITEPGKLMRIAVMLREVQEEARRADADEAGRGRLAAVHRRALSELSSVLNDDLKQELSQFTIDFSNETPSQSEILIAQAQLIGWLEGLFQGIQAAIFNQQAAAKKQLDAMRKRGLPPGSDGDGGARSPGNYL